MNDQARITVIGELANMTHDSSDTIEETTDRVEFITMGKWFFKNKKHHILYDDHELIENQVTKTRVTLENNTVSIRRTGASNNHLIFEKGISHQLPYETPFGILSITSTTEDIHVTLTETRLELKVIYRIELDHENMGTNTFHIISQRTEESS